MRIHEHEVHAKGFIGRGTRRADLFAQRRGVHAARSHDAQRTGIGACRGKRTRGDIGHTALYKGKLGSQELVELHVCPFHAARGNRLPTHAPTMRQPR